MPADSKQCTKKLSHHRLLSSYTPIKSHPMLSEFLTTMVCEDGIGHNMIEHPGVRSASSSTIFGRYRCGCNAAGFVELSRNMAVYHNSDPESSGREELDALKLRIDTLEKELHRERRIGRGGLLDRLVKLEELVEKENLEREVEIRNIHRGIGGLWQNVGLLNKRTPYYDDRIEGLVDDVHRIHARMIELDDASMKVEDRVDTLENTSARTLTPPKRAQRRKASTPPAANLQIAIENTTKSGEGDAIGNFQMPMNGFASGQEFLERDLSGDRCEARSWTVHVSLMPTSSQPFPFEKDTAAYKRCLSRGLHRKIVVSDTYSDCFKEAVSSAFAPVLRGRPWQPLVAKICDVKNLRGLPMLRQLDAQLVSSDYDVKFLKDYCAVLDGSGKIEDLYIAMTEDTITWVEMRELEQFLPGLESAWSHNKQLHIGARLASAQRPQNRESIDFDVLLVFFGAEQRREDDWFAILTGSAGPEYQQLGKKIEV
ncbi:hypothetical protein BcDW1_9083 [Botrytis cinerea BcDW1]|uniref:Uncharacterized protein n=1 Tax=Botryotinia fuckeliana (strain BcDW1) TaxID=1290391 RepID=M7TLL6_BOTF1|nr:hypothetical protein BcDW1_9083 [Botrytis cinerea BcDW1]